MDLPLIAELNRFAELFQSVLLDFTFSSIVLNIYCPEILLKPEEVRQPCSLFGLEGRGKLKFNDH